MARQCSQIIGALLASVISDQNNRTNCESSLTLSIDVPAESTMRPEERPGREERLAHSKLEHALATALVDGQVLQGTVSGGIRLRWKEGNERTG
jgi:hypothetical protein